MRQGRKTRIHSLRRRDFFFSRQEETNVGRMKIRALKEIDINVVP